MELVDFLRARLDEDEALAREAPPGPWHIGNAVDPTQPCSVHTFPGVRLVADGLNWLVAEHIAHHNPARVLAEVESARQAITVYEAAQRNANLPHPAHVEGVYLPDVFVKGYAAAMECNLRLRARAYRTHRDFDPAWLES